MFMKMKVVFYGLVILMYQNVVYSNDEDISSNSSNDISTTCDEEDIEKRNDYLDKLEKLNNAIKENNFTNEEKRKLLSVIEYAENLCINWDETNSDANHINAVTEVVNEVILEKLQKKARLRNKEQYQVVTNIINICKELKQDLNEILIDSNDNTKSIVM